MMRRFGRLGVAVSGVWLVVAVLVWVWPSADVTLVGARRLAAQPTPEVLIPPVKLAEALIMLESAQLWGVRRDGSMIPPPAPKGVVEEKKVSWSVVATVIQRDQRLVLVSIEKAAPIPVKEGDELPDGSKLLRVQPSAYVVELTENGKTTITNHLIASDDDAKSKKIRNRR